MAQFIDNFCKLPEVKYSIIEDNLLEEQQQDKYGVNDVFNIIITELTNKMVNHEQYKNLSDNEKMWLANELEKQITKDIYDRVYP